MNFSSARERMVKEQLIPRKIIDERVLSTMRTVPRHMFVPDELRHLAYNDAPLPIGHKQTISQPYIVALMTQLLELSTQDKVLEIGTGSGYQAAVLASIARQVYSIERFASLAERARRILMQLSLSNIEILEKDGSEGEVKFAPYDAIIVTAAAPKVPQPLIDQLADNGRMVLPVGGRNGQVLERWRRKGDDFSHERIAPVAFVPLVGDHGWDSEEHNISWRR
ncbi:MAG: protein-L-isoaspartate(D-aspartate) O-methyltransferase [Chloroflexi bacterium]|nr:protein-L-isoaspartate(D-aspartate) O-methyltransferase [Chloroflexota bacterium]